MVEHHKLLPWIIVLWSVRIKVIVIQRRRAWVPVVATRPGLTTRCHRPLRAIPLETPRWALAAMGTGRYGSGRCGSENQPKMAAFRRS